MLITTDQAKGYLKLNATLGEENFSPFIPDATSKYIKPLLGNELFALLETWAGSKDETETELAALYEKVAPALSRFTFFLAAPHLDINIGESGFTVVSSGNNLVPASKERVERFMKSLEQLAWDRAEDLLIFLEENQSSYPEWVASDAYTMQLRNLINSATEFDKYVDIDKSRLTFQKFRQEMDNIERIDVIPLISEALFNTLIGKIKSGTDFTSQEEKLVESLRAFVANKIAARVLGKDNQLEATFYLKEAKALININPNDFPDYRDSGIYDAENPDIPPFSDYDNTAESSIFVA